MRLGADMQKIKVGDLDFNSLTESTQQLIRDLQTAQTALEKTFNASFREAASGSKELQEAFSVLKIDPEKMSAAKVGQKLAEGLQRAQKDLDETNNKIKELQQKSENLTAAMEAVKANPFAADKSVKSSDLFAQFFDVSKAKEVSNNLVTWVDGVKEKLSAATESLKDTGDKDKVNSLIQSLVGTDGPETIKQKISEIVKAIQEGSDNLNTVRQQFDIKNKTSSTKSIVESIFGSFDFQNFNASNLKGQLESFLEQFGDLNLSGDQKEKLVDAAMGITEKDIEAGQAKIIEAIARYREAFQREIAKLDKEAGITQKQLSEAMTKATEQTARTNVISTGQEAYLDKIKALEEANANQQKHIEDLEKQVREALTKTDTRAAGAGQSTQDFANEQLREGAAAAQQYAQQLKAAKEAEQLVGKIEGIAQRWFSVYAAVNMVSNAIRSMKSTIEELDKTITEIAIVTDMSQADLWGQMDSYTTLAREYASSISGVYQVSQLYYQQGSLNI